jgi:hypothetical protein
VSAGAVAVQALPPPPLQIPPSRRHPLAARLPLPRSVQGAGAMAWIAVLLLLLLLLGLSLVRRSEVGR